MKLKVGDVLKLQQALAPLVGGNSMCGLEPILNLKRACMFAENAVGRTRARKVLT